jgi:putative two-component system response regulator
MRILLVDDNDHVRALARVYAEQETACEVVEVPDGLSALREARDRDFDLAIVDFHMPGIDGLETARRLIAHQPDLPVVAWTSVLDPAIERAFVEAGAAQHVAKTDTDGLRRVIRERSRATTPPPASAAA